MSAFKTQIGGDHYSRFEVQPTEYIIRNKLDFYQGNVIKYITRHKHKGGSDDVKKAIHYCQMILEVEYAEEEMVTER